MVYNIDTNKTALKYLNSLTCSFLYYFIVGIHGHISFVFYKHWMEWDYSDIKQPSGKEELSWRIFFFLKVTGICAMHITFDAQY
jgi:hypothetical protein